MIVSLHMYECVMATATHVWNYERRTQNAGAAVMRVSFINKARIQTETEKAWTETKENLHREN